MTDCPNCIMELKPMRSLQRLSEPEEIKGRYWEEIIIYQCTSCESHFYKVVESVRVKDLDR